MSPIIVIDIGNTSAQAAVARGANIASMRRIPSQQQSAPAVSRFLRAYARCGKIEGAMISSVVPSLTTIWMKELRRIVAGPVMLLNHKLNLGIKLKYPRPGTIGTDRLADAAAAARHGTPAIVADFGTALTVDAIAANGEFTGGVIAPGPMLFTEYLAEKTALLPTLNRSGVKKFLQKTAMPSFLGRNTRQAMLLGLRLGYAGLVKEILACLARRKGFEKAPIYATGGYAEMALAGTDLKISIDPLLTLRGLSLVYHLNQPKSG